MKNFIKRLIFLFVFLVFPIYISSFFFIINKTRSMETGIYYIYSFSKLERGDIVVFNPVEDAKEYIEKGTKYMMKRVVALEGDKIEVINDNLFVNSKYYGKVFKKDKRGKELKHIENMVLSKNEVFLIGEFEGSFDSRYWGTLKEKDIYKKAKLILKF